MNPSIDEQIEAVTFVLRGGGIAQTTSPDPNLEGRTKSPSNRGSNGERAVTEGTACSSLTTEANDAPKRHAAADD